jgi:hypothetical protein
VADYSPDGTIEYTYPRRFIVNGDAYEWWMSSNHTKGHHLCTHYELWFHGAAFPGKSQKISTGQLTKVNLRKGFRQIYEYYKNLPNLQKEER